MNTQSIRNKDGIWINTQVFREAALHYEKYGYYCNAKPGSYAFREYWDEELRRMTEGYEVAGCKITGYHYAYLNYNKIKVAVKINEKVAKKVEKFPDFWDGDYTYFWTLNIARYGVEDSAFFDLEPFKKKYGEGTDEYLMSLFNNFQLLYTTKPQYLTGGYHVCVGKARRKGYSYKNASICATNYHTKRNSKSFICAYEEKYAASTMSMVNKYLDWFNSETAFFKSRDEIDRQLHKKASKKVVDLETGSKSYKGYGSEILTRTFKDNPDPARGLDGDAVLFEESGAFGSPGLLKKSIAAVDPVTRAGKYMTGQIVIFGCVCKGTKVWDKYGKLVNIEDITKDTGILGYASKGVISENISWLKPPAKKDCVRITTEKGFVIECSTDHPLLWSKKYYKDKKTNKKLATFKEAKDIEKGDHLLQCLQVPKFGNKKMWNPRLVGLLIGDGYYGTYHSSSQLAVSQKEILDWLDEKNINYTIYDKKSSNKPFFRYITIQHTQTELRYLGIQGQSKKKKRLPSNIWDYDKQSVAELLGGYFDADGSISSTGNRKKIQLTSCVKELLEEVKIQLYKFGIQSNIYERTHKKNTILKSNVTGNTSIIKTSKSWSLEICDLESIRNFKKHISFIVKSKQEVLNSWDLSERNNEEKLEYQYEHTIEKGDYFISNPDLKNLKARRVLKVEFIGKKDVYNLSADFTHTYITNGFVSHNTSGDLESGTADFADIFYSPEKFNMFPIINEWDPDVSKDSLCSYFHPNQWNFEGFYDEQGNSDIEGALEHEMNVRKNLENAGASSKDIQTRGQEFPTCPAEAFLMASSNDFPVIEIRKRIDYLKSNKLYKKLKPAKLYLNSSGNVEIEYDLENRLTPIYDISEDNSNNRKSAICIAKEPITIETEVDGKKVKEVPKNAYLIGFDPYRQDEGTSNAAIYVIMPHGKHNRGAPYIAAMYVGRPENADIVNRHFMHLCMLYNSEGMYENEVTHVKPFFAKNKKLSYLASQPDDVINANIYNSRVKRVYGCHMNKKLKESGEKYLNSFLREVVNYDEDGKPITFVDNCDDLGFLQECLKYNSKDNFDRIMAMMQIMFQYEQLAIDEENEMEEQSTISFGKQLVNIMNKNKERYGLI